MRFTLSLLGLLLYAIAAAGQKQGNIWYFGERAGLDFNSGSPVALSDGVMVTNEGCASIADHNGNLLFYTDGVSIWNRSHKVMPKGSGLFGHSSSTQSGIIVPKPLDPNIYYVFTIDAEAGNRGLRYTLVDMTMDGGYGEVVFANEPLHAPVCEKLTAVLHANRKDFWVIAHDWNSENYIVYKVTDAGVITSPQVYKTGVYHGGAITNSIGYLKVSPGGNYLASAIKGSSGSSNYQVFDFNDSTGEIKFKFGGGNTNAGYYGVEFSPDNTKLYLTAGGNIDQVDLQTGTVTQIDKEGICTALQLAPDRKIYVSRTGTKQLGVIQKPNEAGLACSYSRNGPTLTGVCRSGLPTFVQSFFEPVSAIQYETPCKGEPVQFYGQSNIEPTDWKWDFGDPASGAANFSDLQDPQHTYQLAGSYIVQLIIRVEGVYDTVKVAIEVLESPKIDLGKDIIRCQSETITLDAGNPGMQYTWSTGSTLRTLQVSKSGTYWVNVSNGPCSATDTIRVTLVDTGLSIAKDTLACRGDTVVLTNPIPGAKYFWSNGDTTVSTRVTTSGPIIAMATIGSCLIRDTVMVTFIDPPHVELGESRMICEGDSVELDAGNPGAIFLWSTGAATQKIKIYIGGKYWVAVKGGGCHASDTIKLLHCRSNAWLPNVFTPNGDNLNDRFRVFGTDIAKGTLTITNRWGEKVWQSEDIFTGWDGMFRGRKSPEGVYLWSLLYWEYEGEVLYPREMRGTMTLLRR